MSEVAPPPEAVAAGKVHSMERRKRRREADKERHRLASDSLPAPPSTPPVAAEPPSAPAVAAPPRAASLHMNLFNELASADSSAREAAASALAEELRAVQVCYQENGEDEGEKLDAEKRDGLENLAPSLRYAIRRLIRGVSSSREYARLGFALGFLLVVETIDAIDVRAVMQLTTDVLEVNSSMKGQDAKDNLLGRLFAFAALARSGRITGQWLSNKSSSIVKDFVTEVAQLAVKKRYLSEPAVFIILDITDKLPDETLWSEVLETPAMFEWLERAVQVGDPDALFLVLKLQERINVDKAIFGGLVPAPFNQDTFFSREHLLSIAPCFMESIFCLPRIHSLWEVVINMLIPDSTTHDDAAVGTTSSRKSKKRKTSPFDDIRDRVRNFCEVIIERSLILSSYDRKHLAFHILLILLRKLPSSCIQLILSGKVVRCLIDVLSNESSWLHDSGEHFLKDLVNQVIDDDDRRAAAVVSLQKNSGGRFDNLTKRKVVKQLIARFDNAQGCLFFVRHLVAVFLDEGPVVDEPSDQSQTTDENSEAGSVDEKDFTEQGSVDALKNWVIDTIPCVLNSLKLNSGGSSSADEEIMRRIQEKHQVKMEILKFLAVQGLFSASLGTEVTSFELKEKFKWPKTAVSSSLRKRCIEQIQLLLENAQKDEGSQVINEVDCRDSGSYFMRFMTTVCSIPSVSLYRVLNNEDEEAYKKILSLELKLSNVERGMPHGLDSHRVHTMRYLLIQVLLLILLHPGEFSEAARDLIKCCNKAFPSIVPDNSSEDEDESNDGEAPHFMDVLVGTFLSLLFRVSGPTGYAIEQVFRAFCGDITESALLDMLRVVKKDLKPPRHQASGVDSEDDSDDDFLDVEEADDVEEEVGDTGEDGDESEGKTEPDLSDKNVKIKEDDPQEMDEGEGKSTELASDDSDGMDDDAMFRIDPYIARIFRERKVSGGDNAQLQLAPFKFRVLSLVEVYLQRNSGSTHVLQVYAFLMQALVKSHATEGTEKLRERITGILQKKVFKARDYPKGDDVQLTNVVSLLEKSLKLASVSRFKTITSVAQNATFWMLKIITAKNYQTQDLDAVIDTFQNILSHYFNSKKSRLKLGFVKEAIRRYPWIGERMLGFLLEKCSSAKAEFRKVQTLDLVDGAMRACVAVRKGADDSGHAAKFMKKHMAPLCELIGTFLGNLPEKKSRRTEVRRCCVRILQSVLAANGKKYFVKALNPEVLARCQSELGDAFRPFTKMADDSRTA